MCTCIHNHILLMCNGYISNIYLEKYLNVNIRIRISNGSVCINIKYLWWLVCNIHRIVIKLIRIESLIQTSPYVFLCTYRKMLHSSTYVHTYTGGPSAWRISTTGQVGIPYMGRGGLTMHDEVFNQA